MPASDPSRQLESFQTFGDLLKYLRRRARLAQRELSIAVKYSEAQISRLEQNQRPPDLAALTALFIPALYLEEEPLIVDRLMELAAQARGEKRSQTGTVSLSQSVQQETKEHFRIVEKHVRENLPLQLTSFVGREVELAQIKNLLSPLHGTSRLITLTGSGGCGKTRLAMEAARQVSPDYRDGVWLVELAPVSNPSHVAQTFLTSLGLTHLAENTPIQTLTTSLRAKQSLLIVDNCEHVLAEAMQLIEEILHLCPQIQVLATSREILNIPGEIRFQVPALSVSNPEQAGEAIHSQPEAVQLFIERAQAAFPAFPLDRETLTIVRQICERLDGMPLAIELAAARTNMLSIREIAVRLEQNAPLLSGGGRRPAHHKTMDATIQWSYDLLSERERIAFNRLSVFAGGWTLDAAEFVLSDSTVIMRESVLDLLSQLVNKSLVIVDWQLQAQTRYTMLQTLRMFAQNKLRAPEEREATRSRHFEYFFQMAEQGEEHLFTAKSSVDWAEREIDNLRAALAWSTEKQADGNDSGARVGRALELMIHIWPLWLSRGYSIEGNDWLGQLLPVYTAATPAHARALMLAGDLAGFKGDSEKKAMLTHQALDTAQQTGDRKVIGMALMEMGLVKRDDHYPQAVECFSASLEHFREIKDRLWECRTSFLLAETHIMYGELEAAKPLLARGLELCRAENDKWQIAWGLELSGTVQRLDGNFEQARQFYAECLSLKAQVMDKLGIAYSLAAFARLATAQTQFQRAAILWGAAQQLGQTMNLMLIPSKEGPDKETFIETRAQLGEETFQAAWDQGWSMKLQEAIQYALTRSTR